MLEDQKEAIICPFIKLTSCEWSDPKSYSQPCILIAFPGFWFWWPMIQLQELLLTKPNIYSKSVALWPLVPSTGHDSHRVLLGFPPCL